MAKRGGGGCTGAFEQIFRGAFVVSAVVGLLSIGVWATSCLDDFDPDPLGPGVYADVVTTNECPTTAGLTYTFTSSGDGPDPVGGFGITGNKLAPKSGAGDDTTTERLTIESSDGKAFVFHSAYFDLNPATFGTGFTISGKGPEPFTAFTGPPGTAGTYGPTTPKLVTSVEITSVDFFDDWIDDVTYENAVPGAGIYGAGNLIENGDPSPSTSDDTDFGSTPVGVPITKTFTIQSIGNLPLDLDGSPYVDFSSNPSGDFSVTAQPTVDPIAAGNSDTFTIQFNPSSADDKTAVVSISNNSEADDYTFTIGGEGTGAPEIGVTRGVTPIADGGTDAQGSKNAGTQVTLTYTVENTGNATLTVDPITSSGPSNVSVDSINPTVLSIAASNSDTFTVKYTPLAAGAFSFALEITNTDADENPYDITVSGTGVDVTKPDVTIEEAAGQSDPTNGTPINFDVVFTESVTGFETGDVTVGGTANPDTGTVTGSGTTYNVAVSGMTNDGTVTATIPADMAQDAASNANNASTSTDNSVTYDGTPPTDPTPSSASHTVSVWGNDNTVDIQIFGASDTGSGVDGFEIQWDKSASWTPTEAKEQEETWGGATFTATSDGDWYFHIATVDNVGNWTSTEHLGPFQIDTTDPSVPTGLSPVDGTYTNDISPTLSWNASTDTGGSGLRTTGTYNVTVTGTPSKDYYTPNLTYEPTLAEGAFTWSLHSRDNAGNDSAETATLNLYIDRTDPNDPSLGCSSHCVGTPSNDPNVCMTCGSATDPTSNGVASGVDGFEIAFDKNPTWTPDGLKDVEETWPGDTFTATSDGAWYFHLATVDNAGNWTSTEHFGPLDIDTVDPSVTDVAVDTDPVYEGDLTQFVTVTFNEPMLDDATADPTITFSAGTWTSAGDGGYDPTTIRIWTETFTLTDNEEENVGVTVDVTGAKDAAGNDQEDYTALPEFDIDVNRPSVSTVAVDTDPVYEGDLTQFVTVTLDEAMLDDDTADPVITFSAGATWTSAGDGAYDTTDKIWTETFTLTDNEEEAVGVTVDVTGARDAAGNLQEDYTPLPEFDVDVNKPSVIGVVIDTSPVYEGDLTQQVTVTFDEAMSTRTIPEIVFSHGAAWTEDTGSRLWSALDTVFTVTYTLADNDEEFYDRTPGVDVVTVDVTEAKDAAGNDQEDYAPQAEFDIDTLQPTLIDATSTSADGCYTTGANIDVSLIFSEDVHCFCPPMPHLFLRLVLDSGGARAATYHVRIDSFGFMGLTDTANGTYTVAADENSCDLTLLSCTWTGMWPESLTDWAGNEIDCAGPPPSSNIADHKEIVVDTTLPTAIQDPNGDEDRTASADSEIVVVRLDPYGQYRLAVRKNTPVYLDVKFNDTDLPCAVLLMIHDIPNPPANGSAWFDDPAGNIRYAPDEGYVGPDEFTYRIYDACGNISLEETAYIEVVPQLVVEDQYLSTCVDEPIEFDVTVADLFIPEEEFTFTIFDGPYHGVVLGDLDDLEEGLHGLTTNELETLTASLAYVPSEGYAGLDHVQLRIVDGFGGEVIAWIDIAVGGCGPPDGGPPGPDVHADPGDILPMVVPLTFAVIHETAWASVTLTSVETGISYAGALSAVWSEEIGRFVLSVDSTGLPPGEYLLVIPLGNDETVTLVIEVGES